MSAQSNKQENVFDLVKSMTKAEKRNFKLFATRLSGNHDAKFLALFDCMESIEEYDEAYILAKCPVKKEQLPNMKAHLYKQILKSIRQLGTQHSIPMEIHENLDYARILYDKGLYRQSLRILEKTKEQAMAYEQHATAIDIIEFQKKIETLWISRSMGSKSEISSRKADRIFRKVANVNELSNISNQLYSLYLKLGYARSQKDLDLILQVFEPKFRIYASEPLSFTEKVYFYQAQVWYHYIRHDMLTCYKYARRWIELFYTAPQMKELMYDLYIMGYSRLLEGLYLLHNHRRFVKSLDRFEQECGTLATMNTNARMIALQILYTHQMNRHFYEGTFSEGAKMIPQVTRFIEEFEDKLDIHYRMLLYYKIASMYFGSGDYLKCNEYLNKIIVTRDPQIRRDLQCYARILRLISSYEAGLDYNIDYQARSAYLFLVKMNDLHEVQKEMVSFLKRINSMYDSAMKSELRNLYDRIKPFENHPYEKRSFYYLDVISWLEGKLGGRKVADVIRGKFLAETSGGVGSHSGSLGNSGFR